MGRAPMASSSGHLAWRPSSCVCNKQPFLGHIIELFLTASGTSLCGLSLLVAWPLSFPTSRVFVSAACGFLLTEKFYVDIST